MKKRTVPLGLAVASAAAIFAILSCSPPGSDVPSRIALHDPDALFVGAPPQAVPEPEGPQKALFELLPDGTVSVVLFENETGRELACDVEEAFILSRDYLGLRFTCEGTSYRAVVELATGSIIDLSAYNLDSAQVIGDTLVAPDDSGALWRIDISSRSAVAANNPAYLPVTALTNFRTTYGTADGINRQAAFLLDANLDILAVKDGSGEHYILYADNSVPYAPGSDHGSLTYEGIPNGAGYASLFNGPDGSLYLIWRDQEGDYDMIMSKLTFGPTGVLTEETTLALGFESVQVHRTLYSLQDFLRFIPCSSGYIRTFVDSGDHVTGEYVDTSIPSLPLYSGDDAHEYPLVAGEYLYWKSGDLIRRFHFAPSSTDETVVSTTNLIWFEVVNDVVFFARFLSGTEVGTYRVDTPGAEPVLVQSSDMEIVPLVEF